MYDSRRLCNLGWESTLCLLVLVHHVAAGALEENTFFVKHYAREVTSGNCRAISMSILQCSILCRSGCSGFSFVEQEEEEPRAGNCCFHKHLNASSFSLTLTEHKGIVTYLKQSGKNGFEPTKVI